MLKRRLPALLLALLLLAAMAFPSAAETKPAAEDALQDTARYLHDLVAEPTVSGLGGDWTVLGLARSGLPVERAYYDGYLARAAAYIAEKKGILHQRKYTEYSRVVLVLTALGQDPRSVGGYDVLSPLFSFDAVSRQGLTGAAFALLALDSGGYDAPEGLRQQYVDHLLAQELEGGGFALSGVVADPDVTAMVLQSLAPYGAQEAVAQAAERAFARLSALQKDSGGFASYGVECSESAAQVLLALDAWGLPFDDPRFVKNGHTAAEALLSFWRQGQGFVHTAQPDQSIAIVSCEQGLLALVALHRRQEGRSSLYAMTDVCARFPELSGHPARQAVEELTALGVISGMGDGTFRPDAPLDRASFCTMAVKLLGLTPRWTDRFDDVAQTSWYGGYLCAAAEAGITQGVSARQFSPLRQVTREEGAVMLYRTARAMDLVSERQDGEARSWTESLAWCREAGLWLWPEDADGTLTLLRGEAAQLLWALTQMRKA